MDYQRLAAVGEVVGFDAELVEHRQVEVGQGKFQEPEVSATAYQSGNTIAAFWFSPAC